MTLRNQYGEELELSSLLVCLDMRRQSSEAEVLNPHVALQADRCLTGMISISSNLKHEVTFSCYIRKNPLRIS